MLFVFITNYQIYQAEGGTPLVQRPMLQARGAQERPARAPSRFGAPASAGVGSMPSAAVC